MQLAAVVLAAGSGTRLRPLTDLRPKPLCPVGNVALLDHALARVLPHADQVAVNVHAHPDRMVEHVGAHPAAARIHLSHEQPEALGTAGALGALQDWLDDRPVLVVNADTYSHEADGQDSVATLLAGWEGRTTRLLCRNAGRPSDFGTWQYVGAALMPASEVRGLPATPSGLYELRWAAAHAAGNVELVATPTVVVDCGTPADYLAANLLSSGGRSVIGAGAQVAGTTSECVVWPGATVEAGEHLHRVIRAVDGEGRPLTVEAVQRPKLTGRGSA